MTNINKTNNNNWWPACGEKELWYSWWKCKLINPYRN
jgi:hypothetical protein